MRSKLPYIILGGLFLGYVLLEILGPQPQNWNPSFRQDKSTPFGSELLYERLPDIFPGVEIRSVEESPAKVLKVFEKKKANYLILQEEFKTDQFEAKALLDFVERGNHVFIAASTFDGALADSLDIVNVDRYWAIFDLNDRAPAKDDYITIDPQYDPDQKHFPLLDNIVYNDFDYTDGAEVLSSNKTGRSMYIRIDRGEGSFYLHSVPLLFTNYSMVDPVNHQYVSKALSFMPVNDIIWDEHFKPGRVKTDSPVRYLLSDTSLSWAWFVALAGVLLFMLFESKRKQRIIPVVEPPSNTTLEFTRTVGMLYHSHADHKDISEKKIKFLLEHIRNRWNLPTHDLGPDFREKLSAKSGVHRTEIEQLFGLIDRIHNAKEVEEEALLQLSRWIEKFHESTR